MTVSIDDDVKTLHAMGYAQELSRRMSGFSNFAISFSIICILAGGITSFPLAMGTGSGFEACIGWLVGGIFALIVAAGLAQIGSTAVRFNFVDAVHGVDSTRFRASPNVSDTKKDLRHAPSQ
jgi:hypothetical protein